MTSREPGEALYTPAEVAVMFRVDPKTVTRWAKAGRLSSIRTLGGHRRYRQGEVDALLGATPAVAADNPLDRHVRTLWPVRLSGPALTARNKVVAAGIGTVGELAGYRAADLVRLGFTPLLIDHVRTSLYHHDLALQGETADQAAA